MFRRKTSDSPSERSPTTKANAFCTKLIATSSECASSESQDIEEEEEGGRVSEDAADSSTSKEPVIIIQPDLDVAPHLPPTSTMLSVLPVYVDYEGVIYAHDMAEGEGCVCAEFDVISGLRDWIHLMA